MIYNEFSGAISEEDLRGPVDPDLNDLNTIDDQIPQDMISIEAQVVAGGWDEHLPAWAVFVPAID